VGVASWKHKGTPERIESVLNPKPEWKDRVEIITHDLVSPFTPLTKKRIGKIDYIVNCAAESHVDRSITDPVPFVQNNVNIALTMLEFAKEVKPEIFLQVSTDEVYGVAPNGHNHKEWETILPSNPYSASKACQEAIAISYWRTYGVPLVITNTMNNVGETQDPEKYVAKVIKFVESGEVVPIHGQVINGVETFGSRYYLHARNHADAILYILRNLPPVAYKEGEHLRPDRYNIVGDEEVDNLQMAQKIAEILEKPLKYEVVDHHSTRPGHDRRYALDGGKLKSLGWVPPTSLWDSMRRYIKWTLKNPFWL
jgi:dTDP-glucose 4,6-dehydratase